MKGMLIVGGFILYGRRELVRAGAVKSQASTQENTMK
jgi:hypothetical protein